MSLDTESDVVPFKVTAWQGDMDATFDFSSQPFADFLRAEIEGDNEEGGQYAGWEVSPEVGRFLDLYTTVLRKGDAVVHHVNEDKYASGGGYQASFFSERKRDLEEFTKDFLITAEIESKVKCYQTL